MVAIRLTDLDGLPVHGPTGRIGAVRVALGLRQVDFARAIVSHGGRASRETVSHWENLDDEGKPRARMTRRNSRALVALLRESCGLEAPDDLFYEPDETAWDALNRRQLEFASQMDKLTRLVESLKRKLDSKD